MSISHIKPVGEFDLYGKDSYIQVKPVYADETTVKLFTYEQLREAYELGKYDRVDSPSVDSPPVIPKPAFQAITDACDTAMRWTVAARVPECGTFGEIAQNLSYALQEINAKTVPQAEAQIDNSPRLVSYGINMETCTLHLNGEEYYFDFRASTVTK